jgi:hypothetical protein
MFMYRIFIFKNVSHPLPRDTGLYSRAGLQNYLKTFLVACKTTAAYRKT